MAQTSSVRYSARPNRAAHPEALGVLPSRGGRLAGLRLLLAEFGAAQEMADNPLVRSPRGTPGPRGAVLIALLLACLVPRAWMAYRIPALCPDATLYVSLAKSLDRGDIDAGFEDVHFNTFTIALVALHRLGLDWESAGRLWCLGMSSCAVFPLFGWVRRQFDDRVAILASLLYAVHPSLVEKSPELIREPTFWFSFLLALYFFWRGITELRLSWFVAAGCAWLFSLLTRFEGAFLLIPFFGWSVFRAASVPEVRLRLMWGTALAVLTGPAIVLSIKQLLLPDASFFDFIRIEPIARAFDFLPWKSAWLARVSSLAGVVTEPGLTGWAAARLYARALIRGLDPVFAIVLFVSLLTWRGLWVRRDVVPLLVMSLVIEVAAWLHLAFSNQISSRYTLTVVTALCPLAALGLCRRGGQAAGNRGAGVQSAIAGLALCCILGAITIYGLIDALGTHYQGREEEARLGREIASRFRTSDTLRVTTAGRNCAIVAYYTGGELQRLPYLYSLDPILDGICGYRSDVVLLEDSQQSLLQALTKDYGYARYVSQAAAHSRNLQHLVVLVRDRRVPVKYRATARAFPYRMTRRW